MKVGDKVTHPKKPEWGIGEVTALPNGKIEVHFANEGFKSFSIKHINLTLVGDLNQARLSLALKKKFQLFPSPFKDPTKLFSEEYWHTYPPAYKHMFSDGSLVQEWMDQYPTLFDQNDEELVLGHRGQKLHFFREWLGAILIHQKFGHSCLCGNYTHNAHQSKQMILGALFKEAEVAQIRKIIFDDGRHGLPPLLFYTADFSHKYFVHVRDAYSPEFDYHENKAPTPLTPEQIKNFRWIKEELKLEVKIINLQVAAKVTRLLI